MNNYNKTLMQLILNKPRENRRGNQDWTIKTHKQHCTQDTGRRQTK
jgi:hypothetical protein